MNKKKEQHLKNKNSKTPRETHNLTVKVLNSWLDKSKGLIGMDNIYPVYFETRFGIHTFGMTKPIDVFILNKENKVVKICKNIKPGRFFIWNPKYYKVLETPVDFIKINILDEIIF